MSDALRPFFGAAIGAAVGLGWHRLVGCRTGACPLTARWWSAALYGAVLGGLALAR